MRILIVSIFVLVLSACTQTENGLVFGIPDYEKRNISVSQVDLDILNRAKEILYEETSWDKKNVTSCNNSEKYNLYCALERASIDVMGKYIHRQAALQEVRFVIDDNFKERWNKHRLADFNSHTDTRYNDVKLVIDMAIVIVDGKLTHNKEQ